jgi:hypothetical protein
VFILEHKFDTLHTQFQDSISTTVQESMHHILKDNNVEPNTEDRQASLYEPNH